MKGGCHSRNTVVLSPVLHTVYMRPRHHCMALVFTEERDEHVTECVVSYLVLRWIDVILLKQLQRNLTYMLYSPVFCLRQGNGISPFG